MELKLKRGSKTGTCSAANPSLEMKNEHTKTNDIKGLADLGNLARVPLHPLLDWHSICILETFATRSKAWSSAAFDLQMTECLVTVMW